MRPRVADGPTRSQAGSRLARRLDAREELDVLIRARYAMIYVVSWEEDRVERYLREIAERRNKHLFVWTVTQGINKSGSDPQRTKAGAGIRPIRWPLWTP